MKTQDYVCIVDPVWKDQAYCIQKQDFIRQNYNKQNTNRSCIEISVPNPNILDYMNRGYIKDKIGVFPMFTNDLAYVDKIYRHNNNSN